MTEPACRIRTLINQERAISFTRFMEVALYCPLYGYYEKKKDTTGKRGDFYTSVSVGSLFGELLAFQFADWFTAAGRHRARRFRLVEAGAHDGTLAHDILAWFQRQRPALLAKLEYLILEPSATRRGWQRTQLQAFSSVVRWEKSFPPESQKACAQHESPYTILFSNELLDAFPVHRLGWDAHTRTWFEWGVTIANDRFAWTRLPELTCTLPAAFALPIELLRVLPNGFTAEICPAAEVWWRDASSWLSSGRILAFDYGLTTEEYLSPHRSKGTLRAYRNHQLIDDVLADPGEQDLTAHVNFSVLESAGLASGLRTESMNSQAQFLTQIAESAWRSPDDFGSWNSGSTRQFQTLIHPNHLGTSFRVLLQAR